MRIFWLVLAGISSGIIGGMGMGGGTILIPVLTLLLSVSQKTAQAINLVAFLPMAVITLIIHAKNGYLKLNRVWWIALGSAVAGVGGAFVASYISGKILRIILGAFLIALAIVQIILVFARKNKTT